MTAARRRMLRWGLRAAFIAAFVALVSVDARMKGGAVGGFIPADAQWVAYAPHFSGVWSGLARTSAFRDFIKQWPAPNNNAQLHVRLTAGIRPTPLRWSTWLGKKAVVFGSESGIGWCVKPGVLLRAAHALNAAVFSQTADGGFVYGPYHYAWRDGFVIFSTVPEVVKSASSGIEFKTGVEVKSEELYVEWKAAPKGSLVLRAFDGLPVRGDFESASQVKAGELLPWPEEPFLHLNTSKAEDFAAVARLLRDSFSALPEWCRARNLIPDASSYLDAAGQAGSLVESGLALYPPGTKESRVPESALRFRFAANAPALPGIASAMKAVAVGPYWYLASSEPALQALGTPVESAPGVEQALDVGIQWGDACKTFEKCLRAVLEDDDTLREAIEGTGVPCTQALATLGRLEIRGRHEDGKLRFEGFLAQPVEKPAAR